jgi:DNA ligase (NAD+)
MEEKELGMDVETAGKELIVAVNDELLKARHAYYVLSQPIMTDAVYDGKEKDLKEMVRQMPQFTSLATALATVGDDTVEASGRIRHSSPMLSLENQYTFDDLKSWCGGFPEDTMYVVEPKIDGASLSLVYKKRKLVRGVTRGDGTAGENVLDQMIASGAIAEELPEEFYPETPVEVRGEVYMTTGQFDKINATADKPYASPRNLAAGTMKLQDLEEVKKRGLRFWPWQVEGIPAEYLAKRNLQPQFAHHQIQYYALTINKNFSPNFSVFTSAEALCKALDTHLRAYRDTVMHVGRGILTDGYVIKVASTELRKKAGVGSKCPNWAVAFKYPSALVGTKLLGVNWFVGRTGGLTPVASVTPTNVSGAVVSNVNLNNLSWIKEKGIKIGDEVSIKRGGEVIPVLDSVISTSPTSITIEAPDVCPSCGEGVRETQDAKSGVLSHWCVNPACNGRLAAYLGYVAGRDVLEIDELGPETITKLIEEGYVASLADLFTFAANVLTGVESKGEGAVANKLNKLGIPGSSTIKMARSLEKVKTRDWDRWLAALGIPGIARTLSKMLSTHFRLGEKDMDILPSILSKGDYSLIEGIGDKKEAELRRYLPTIEQICKDLYEAGVRPKSLLVDTMDPSKIMPLAGYVMCITGEFLPTERETISKMLTSLGATMKTGVSKKLTHLLVGEGAGQSKLSKANELNIPKLGKEWLTKTLEANGLALKNDSKFEAEWDDL